jgi:hypothetical protein
MAMDAEWKMILEELTTKVTEPEEMGMDSFTSTINLIRESEDQPRLHNLSSSYEAIQVLRVWEQEDNSDVIMSLELEDDEDEDYEGLLPLVPDQEDYEDDHDQISSNLNTPPPEDLFEYVDAVDTDSFSFLNAAQADEEEANKHQQQQASNSTNDPPSPQEDDRDEVFQESLEKLIQSMNKSRETRKCLIVKTVKTEKYPRRASVSQVLCSIENSSRQIDSCLQSLQRVVL